MSITKGVCVSVLFIISCYAMENKKSKEICYRIDTTYYQGYVCIDKEKENIAICTKNKEVEEYPFCSYYHQGILARIDDDNTAEKVYHYFQNIDTTTKNLMKKEELQSIAAQIEKHFSMKKFCYDCYALLKATVLEVKNGQIPH